MKTSQIKTLQMELNKLASAIEEQWKASNYELAVFSDICVEHLKNHSLKYVPDLETILNELTDIELPAQNFANGEFSDFPITLVRSDKLLVDLYYWFKSDTSIHNHHFCGAFKVIAGESYQINYAFNKTRSISEGLDEGVLTQIKNEHLTTGMAHPILPYDKFIHHVFHLGKPTITLCIRTPPLAGEGLATFLYPKFRVVLSPVSSNQQKWLQALHVRLEQDPQAQVEIPWSDGEILHILFRSASRQIVISPVVSSFLSKYLDDKTFLPDFFELMKKQPKFYEKLKKFGLVTGPLKGQID